jgi:hypothetical protein
LRVPAAHAGLGGVRHHQPGGQERGRGPPSSLCFFALPLGFEWRPHTQAAACVRVCVCVCVFGLRVRRLAARAHATSTYTAHITIWVTDRSTACGCALSCFRAIDCTLPHTHTTATPTTPTPTRAPPARSRQSAPGFWRPAQILSISLSLSLSLSLARARICSRAGCIPHILRARAPQFWRPRHSHRGGPTSCTYMHAPTHARIPYIHAQCRRGSPFRIGGPATSAAAAAPATCPSPLLPPHAHAHTASAHQPTSAMHCIHAAYAAASQRNLGGCPPLAAPHAFCAARSTLFFSLFAPRRPAAGGGGLAAHAPRRRRTLLCKTFVLSF